jgi:hypothetical protein
MLGTKLGSGLPTALGSGTSLGAKCRSISVQLLVLGLEQFMLGFGELSVEQESGGIVATKRMPLRELGNLIGGEDAIVLPEPGDEESGSHSALEATVEPEGLPIGVFRHPTRSRWRRRLLCFGGRSADSDDHHRRSNHHGRCNQ